MNRKWKWTSIAAAMALLAGSLAAKPPVVNHEKEQEDFPDLQQTEKLLENNIQDAYKRLGSFGHLVALAKEDRTLSFREAEDKFDFRNTFRNIKYTPRNTYVRYVKESAEFLLVGFGEMEDINKIMADRVQAANEAKVNVQALQFGDRDGIELTQFDFIYDPEDPARRAIGSKRKSVTLFFRPGNNAADAQQDVVLDAVVTRLVEDDFKNGIKNVEVVYDPTPLTPEMDDVFIFHRYNYKVPNIAILSTMNNTANFPHRVQFKRKFYVKLLDHYNMLYRLVDGYAQKDSNTYNEEVLELLEKQMEY